MPAVSDIAHFTGRILLAALFAAGVVQKAVAPEGAQALLAGAGLPGMLVWSALAFNAAGAISLITGFWLGPMALLLGFYCIVTSHFHFIPDDPWQMSIFVKNWAIAGGLFVLFGHDAARRDSQHR